MKSYRNVIGLLFSAAFICCFIGNASAQGKILISKDKFEKRALVGKQKDGSYIVWHSVREYDVPYPKISKNKMY